MEDVAPVSVEQEPQEIQEPPKQSVPDILLPTGNVGEDDDDDFKPSSFAVVKAPAKRGRPKKDAAATEGDGVAKTPAKRGRKKKEPAAEGEGEGEDAAAEKTPAKRGRKKKEPAAEGEGGDPTAEKTPAKRGRKKKEPATEPLQAPETTKQETNEESLTTDVIAIDRPDPVTLAKGDDCNDDDDDFQEAAPKIVEKKTTATAKSTTATEIKKKKTEPEKEITKPTKADEVKEDGDEDGAKDAANGMNDEEEAEAQEEEQEEQEEEEEEEEKKEKTVTKKTTAATTKTPSDEKSAIGKKRASSPVPKKTIEKTEPPAKIQKTTKTETPSTGISLKGGVSCPSQPRRRVGLSKSTLKR